MGCRRGRRHCRPAEGVCIGRRLSPHAESGRTRALDPRAHRDGRQSASSRSGARTKSQDSVQALSRDARAPSRTPWKSGTSEPCLVASPPWRSTIHPSVDAHRPTNEHARARCTVDGRRRCAECAAPQIARLTTSNEVVVRISLVQFVPSASRAWHMRCSVTPGADGSGHPNLVSRERSDDMNESLLESRPAR